MIKRKATKATVVRIGVGVVLLILVGLVLYTQLTALTYSGLEDRLDGQGAIIQDMGTKGQLFGERLLAGTEHNLRINGDGMAVFEYHTTLEAFYDTTRFSADGKTMRPSVIPGGGQGAHLDDFPGSVHWFHQGRVILLYMGQQTNLLALLRQVLGPQFAGA
jgi:hypothetical protein